MRIAERDARAAAAGPIVFGSDYPNIPYPYAEAVASIVRLPVSPEAKRRILHDNAAAVFGIGPAASKEAACSG
jgi:hypothetical protein